jgi:hypothetical protein
MQCGRENARGTHQGEVLSIRAPRTSYQVYCSRNLRKLHIPLTHLHRAFVSELVLKKRNLCSAILEPVLEMEGVPFTQNTHYLSESCAKWLGKYKNARSGPDGSSEPPSKRRKLMEPPHEVRPSLDIPRFRPDAAQPTLFGSTTGLARNHPGASFQPSPTAAIDDDYASKVSDALVALARIGYNSVTEESLGKLAITDDYETELQVMAEVRGYFQIAYKVSLMFHVVLSSSYLCLSALSTTYQP